MSKYLNISRNVKKVKNAKRANSNKSKCQKFKMSRIGNVRVEVLSSASQEPKISRNRNFTTKQEQKIPFLSAYRNRNFRRSTSFESRQVKVQGVKKSKRQKLKMIKFQKLKMPMSKFQKIQNSKKFQTY